MSAFGPPRADVLYVWPLRHVPTGAPVIKGAPAAAEATAIPGAYATTEMQTYPASDSDPSGASDVVLLCQITESDPASLEHCNTLPDDEGESSMVQRRCRTLDGSLKPDAAPPPPPREETSSVNLLHRKG